MSAPKTRTKIARTKKDTSPSSAPLQSQCSTRTIAEHVSGKYTRSGRTVMETPKDNINDFIAVKDIPASRRKKYHFVQIVPPGSDEDPKFGREQKNIFIQNALSNSAVPIYAHGSVSTGRTGTSKVKITLEDINLNTRVLVGKTKAGTTLENKI